MTQADLDARKARIKHHTDRWLNAAAEGKDKPRKERQYLGSEAQQQAKVVDWLTQRHIHFHHVPNAGKRNPHTAASQGIIAGTPDLIITSPAPPCGGFRFAAIEMKRRHGGTVSMDQIRWKDTHQADGVAVAICEGAAEAIEQLERWGYGQ
jgi:hypothetical protein